MAAKNGRGGTSVLAIRSSSGDGSAICVSSAIQALFTIQISGPCLHGFLNICNRIQALFSEPQSARGEGSHCGYRIGLNSDCDRSSGSSRIESSIQPGTLN